MSVTRMGRWVGVAWLAFMVGCAGGASKAPATSPVDASGGYAVMPSAVGEPSPSTASMAPPASAPAAPPPPMASQEAAPAATARREARDEAPTEKSPSQRPGLGTEWGETRTSRVRDVAFERADDRPFAVASLRYDDRKGVDALVSLHARTASFREIPVVSSGAITVSLRDADGRPLEARHVGDRTYVIGRAGERYSIVLSNRTPHRVEAVATVDGLDVVNGRAGSFDNRGYLLEPFSSLEIDGFRQSQDAVAAFRFGRVADSYAAQTGSARDVGVIGVAFFDEAGDRFDREDEARLRESASPFPADDRFASPPR